MYYIYLIFNLINYKVYVGQTKDPKNRWSSHKTEVKYNRLRFPIHKALKKYGIENFQYNIVEVCENQNEIDDAEIKWIQELDSRNADMGYNLAIGGNVNRGWHHSEESKKKISKGNIGKTCPTHTDEWKQNMSNIMAGRIINDEWRKKLSKSNKGKIISEETKQKMSTSAMGRQASNKTKLKMSISHSGDKCHLSKLNWEDVNRIRNDYESKFLSIVQLAKIYDVSYQNIYSIIKYKTWKCEPS